jgi:hypothetical protein
MHSGREGLIAGVLTMGFIAAVTSFWHNRNLAETKASRKEGAR